MEDKLKKFISEVQGRSNVYYSTYFPRLQAPRIEMTEGKKFWKIITAGSQRSVMAFINKETGDIYKPAGWNAPAKHARGNINSDQHGLEAVSVCGQYINYLR